MQSAPVSPSPNPNNDIADSLLSKHNGWITIDGENRLGGVATHPTIGMQGHPIRAAIGRGCYWERGGDYTMDNMFNRIRIF